MYTHTRLPLCHHDLQCRDVRSAGMPRSARPPGNVCFARWPPARDTWYNRPTSVNTFFVLLSALSIAFVCCDPLMPPPSPVQRRQVQAGVDVRGGRQQPRRGRCFVQGRQVHALPQAAAVINRKLCHLHTPAPRWRATCPHVAGAISSWPAPSKSSSVIPIDDTIATFLLAMNKGAII